MASAAWEKRNAAARAKGYRNYYDYRVHRYGRSAPSELPASGEEAAQLRGQRGPRTLARALRQPKKIALIVGTPLSDRFGQWTRMRYVVTFTNADIKEYQVGMPDDYEGDFDDWLDDLHDEIDELEIEFIAYAKKAEAAAAA